MEEVTAAVFIPVIIIAVTQLIKQAAPQVTGWVTVAVALGVGIVVALIDTLIGVVDVSVAQGIVFALEAIGLTTLASKAGGGARGDEQTR